MLLDYRAVGVELVIPQSELRNFKDWASVYNKGMKSGRSYQSTNYAISPKVNYQDHMPLQKLP